jgi:hypothetical protein
VVRLQDAEVANGYGFGFRRNLELSVTRCIWHQLVGDCKTEVSPKPVPLDSYMAEDPLRWRRQSAYPLDDDYVFASEVMQGSNPIGQTI